MVEHPALNASAIRVSQETFQRPLQRFASDASSVAAAPRSPPIDLDCWRQQRQRATETPSPQPRGRLHAHSARGNIVSQPGIFTVADPLVSYEGQFSVGDHDWLQMDPSDPLVQYEGQFSVGDHDPPHLPQEDCHCFHLVRGIGGPHAVAGEERFESEASFILEP